MKSAVRRLLLSTGVLLGIGAVVVARQKYRGEQQLFFPQREQVSLPASASGLPGAIDVSFEAGSVSLRGWYVASRNRAAVILTHGAGANRSALVPEARELSNAGFGVLLFDWPGHGESGGEIHWNEGERQALRAAFGWLERQPDVAAERLGVYGFSMGGYVVAQVAARDTRAKAVVLAGTPANQREQVRYQHGRYGWLGELPALWALSRGGMQVDVARPIDEVEKISPRALLVIGGSVDVIVPPSMTPDLYERARTPKDMLMIEGAGHGNYASVAGARYLTALRTFFDRALLGLGDGKP